MAATPLKNPLLVLAALAVLGVLAAGASAARGPLGVGDEVPPSPPANIRAASATASAVTVVWDPSTDNIAVAGYYVRSNDRRSRASGTTFTISRLSCGRVVDVRVTAYDKARNSSGEAAATVSTSPCTDDEPPTTPTAFTQDATTQDAVVLSWRPATDNIGVVGYGVYRNGLLQRSTPGPTVTLTGLSCAATYQYSVDAIDAAGNHSPQASAWVETAACADGSPPSSPTDLQTSAADASTISIGWSPSRDNVDVAGYRVVLDGVPVATVTQTSATVRNLLCGTTHTIAVDAHDAAGNRSPAATITAATAPCEDVPSGDVSPPSSPAGLAVMSATKTSVSLDWSPSTDDVAVTAYGVYANGTRVATTSGTETAVSQLACGTRYTFEVDAVDAAGNRSARAATSTGTSPCSDTTPPTAPTNVAATTRTATSIALTWSPSSDDVGVAVYGVYRGGTPAGTTTTTTAIFSGLTCNTNYTLAVDARDAAGNRSDQAVVMVATTACPDTTPPSTPANLTASAVTQTSLTLSWNASTDNVGVTGYEVLRNGNVVASGPGTTLTQQGLACGTTYALAVVALDASGNRSQPASSTASTAACSPPPPPPTTTTLACGSSLDAAYDAAAAGAVIQLADCSYTGKTITGSKASPGVVFDLGGSNQGSIGLSGAQNVELRNGRGSASLGCQPGRIVLRNYSQTGIFWNNVCNVSWIGGELGPQSSDQINWIYSDSGYGTHDVLLEGLYVHDNRCVSSGCHYEAIRIDRGVDGIVIRNSVFRRNAIFHIFITSLNGSNLSRNITIENNCFDRPTSGSSAVATHDPIVTSVDPALLRIRVLNDYAETGSNFRGPFYESSGNTFGSASRCDTWISGKSTT